ncbi:hypothetical protein GCM10022419_033430 [Nonomuraea rosea]|uniref:Uncharacterized protein n=1 Tax=Nonomuraea rosea TaxID=638574 RepID=A0ABP6WKG3_9ACTN
MSPDPIDLDAVRVRAWDLRWLAPGHVGTARLSPVTVTDADTLLTLDKAIGRDLPALADEVEQLRQRVDQVERERDALRRSIAQRGPGHELAEAVTSDA